MKKKTSGDLMNDPFYSRMMFRIEKLIYDQDQAAQAASLRVTDTNAKSAIHKALGSLKGKPQKAGGESFRDQWIQETAKDLVVLGKALHAEDQVETRPYMRARSELAQRLVAMGRLEDAIAEHEGMLELCPNDNLGIRYPLLGLYLKEDRLEDAARLLKTYEEERPYSAQMGWAYVLERFLTGAEDEAVEALAIARDQNGYVEAYLKGCRKLPKESAGYYSPGSREEAQIAAEFLKPAWDTHPQAVEWLQKGK